MLCGILWLLAKPSDPLHCQSLSSPSCPQAIGGKLRLLNNTEDPLLIGKNDQHVLSHRTLLNPSHSAVSQVYLVLLYFTSLKNTHSSLVEQSTSNPPDGFGISFAADLPRHYRQQVLVTREMSMSFTASCLLDNKCCESIRSGLLRLCLELRPLAPFLS